MFGRINRCIYSFKEIIVGEYCCEPHLEKRCLQVYSVFPVPCSVVYRLKPLLSDECRGTLGRQSVSCGDLNSGLIE